MTPTCTTPVCLYVSQSEYLGVSVEHFDSLGGDEEIHLCHGLRLTLGGLLTHTQTHTTPQSTIRHTLMKLPGLESDLWPFAAAHPPPKKRKC